MKNEAKKLDEEFDIYSVEGEGKNIPYNLRKDYEEGIKTKDK